MATTMNDITYPELGNEDQASCLTSLEKERPERVLSDFFELATVEDVRNGLRKWLFASFQANDGEQFTYIHLWQQLERLIEAGWLLHQRDMEDKPAEE